MPSRYQVLREDWDGCQRCDLCQWRKKVVHARGVLPCDVFFVGEAPGASEDILGRPFAGPAGKLLDRIVADAMRALVRLYRPAGGVAYNPPELAFCNLIGCIPKDSPSGKVGEPSKESILACAQRLIELVDVAQPKLVVCVGNLSEKWTPKILEGELDRKGKAKAGGKSGGRLPGGPAAGTEQRGEDAPPAGRYRYATIIHPAAILRMSIAQQGLAYQRAVVILTECFEDLIQRGDVNAPAQ